jgi:hypothetical protein
MLIGLLTSTQLYSRYGPSGLDVFFGAIAVALIVLTLLRFRDLRSAAPVPVAPESPPSPTP